MVDTTYVYSTIYTVERSQKCGRRHIVVFCFNCGLNQTCKANNKAFLQLKRIRVS